VRRNQAQAYQDQFEYFADCFEWIRTRGDAFNLRSEAMETERLVSYSERTGYASDRSQLLEIYQGIEEEAKRKRTRCLARKRASERARVRFPFDDFIRRHNLGPEEMQILLVLLYNESLGRSHARFTSGNEILNLLFPSPVASLKAARFLDGGATLLAKGLVRVISDDDNTNFLRAAYEVTERTLHEVLGVRDRNTFLTQQQSQASSKTFDRPYRVVAPRVSLDQVVLAAPVRQRLEEVLWQVRDGNRLFREWGMDRVTEKGKGTIVLLAGPPGTGKTMTAEAMAHHLHRPLYQVDYAHLESKWIGETEKNIVAVFREAAAAGAVVLLDEADAILSTRLDGGHYNDRAYNRQVSILLTELEDFDGLCVLTSNRSVALDDGLARRISATFSFGVPGPHERLRIWQALLPLGIPVAGEIDLDALAQRYPLAGGHIKNAIVAAVRKAALREGADARVRQGDLGEAAAAERRTFKVISRPIGFGESPGYVYN